MNKKKIDLHDLIDRRVRSEKSPWGWDSKSSGIFGTDRKDNI